MPVEKRAGKTAAKNRQRYRASRIPSKKYFTAAQIDRAFDRLDNFLVSTRGDFDSGHFSNLMIELQKHAVTPEARNELQERIQKILAGLPHLSAEEIRSRAKISKAKRFHLFLERYSVMLRASHYASQFSQIEDAEKVLLKATAFAKKPQELKELAALWASLAVSCEHKFKGRSKESGRYWGRALEAAKDSKDMNLLAQMRRWAMDEGFFPS